MVPPGAVGESQECYYDAMEANSEEEDFAFCHGHWNLIPEIRMHGCSCWSHTSAMSADEEIGILRKIVAAAEERLGKKAFKKFAGHFWGFHETRPYMRARAALADALHHAGRIESSAAEVEAMLELNPGDNQGLRYRLLAFIWRSRSWTMPGRFSPAIPMSSISTQYLPGKGVERFSPETGRSVAGAGRRAKAESYFQSLCVRPSQDSEEPAGFLSPGSKEEATCFAADLQSVWNAHPAAKKWLAAVTPKS